MLITKILNNHFTPAKRWSARRTHSSKFLKLKNKIRYLLSLLSGNEIVNMLKSVLNKEELYDISEIFVDSLKGIAKNVNNKITLKKRHNFIRPLRLAGFTQREIQKLGFKCGNNLWRDCLNPNERLPGGRPNLNDEIRVEIDKHAESLSNFGANRTISERSIGPYLFIPGRYNGIKKPKPKRLIEKNIISVKYLNVSRREIVKLFNEKKEQVLDKKIPYSTFTKYVHKKYKKAKRLTDLCIIFKLFFNFKLTDYF
jgi:hypothetical protein